MPSPTEPLRSVIVDRRIDPRSPVVVGVGQSAQRLPADVALPPIELLEAAALAAEGDTGARRSILSRVDLIAVVQITSWRYPDPAAFLARRLGIEPRRTCVSAVGGNSPQLLVNEMADLIAGGKADVVLLGGAESMHTRWRARREPRVNLEWDSGDDAACSWIIGDERQGVTDYEMAHAALAPTQVYPLFETALRRSCNRGVAEHQRVVSELWETFAAVAADNSHAWSRSAFSAEEIRTVTPDNRMVCFPYPKRMCANIDVDQGAALLLCSYETARAAGVPDERMVFLHSGADGHDHFFITQRDSLADSPAIAATSDHALSAAGIGVDDIAHFDLYSCFPSAVQIAMRAMGLRGPAGGDLRPLTVTGGLGFAGGPVNNYTTHAIASMVSALRSDPGSFGLTTALGWFVTKHSAGVWSTTPPAAGYKRVPESHTQSRIDELPSRDPAGLVDGKITIEATSVLAERDGSLSMAIIAGLTGDGRRALANTRDGAVLQSLTEEPWEGRRVRVTNNGETNTLAT